MLHNLVIPVKTGIQREILGRFVWIPAYAGMTCRGYGTSLLYRGYSESRGDGFYHSDIGERAEPKGKVFEHFPSIHEENADTYCPMNFDNDSRVGEGRFWQHRAESAGRARVNPVTGIDGITPKSIDAEIFTPFAGRVPKDGAFNGADIISAHRIEAVTTGKRFPGSILPTAAPIQGDHDTWF